MSEEAGRLHRFGLVVIDPVRASTDPTGVLGRIHPAERFSLIVETVGRESGLLYRALIWADGYRHEPLDAMLGPIPGSPTD